VTPYFAFVMYAEHGQAVCANPIPIVGWQTTHEYDDDIPGSLPIGGETRAVYLGDEFEGFQVRPVSELNQLPDSWVVAVKPAGQFPTQEEIQDAVALLNVPLAGAG
jgi:hypothetical protein